MPLTLSRTTTWPNYRALRPVRGGEDSFIRYSHISLRSLLSLFFLLLAIGPDKVLSSANLALPPKSIRQTYADGSYVELSAEVASSNTALDVLICESTAAHRMTISLSNARIRYAYGVPDFRFWSGTDASVGALALDVSCLPSELSGVGQGDDADGECTLMFDIGLERAVASKIKIWLPDEPVPHFITLGESIRAPVQPEKCDLTRHQI